jgi:UDP-glucose:tetrahydrobiopterin glucosyltransferase
LNIALFAPFTYPVIEPFRGGTGAAIYRLATSLTRQNIDVVCYAREGSAIPGVTIRAYDGENKQLAYPRPLAQMGREELLAIHARQDAAMYDAVEDALHDPAIDLLHNHSFSSLPFFLSRLAEKPLMHTLHIPPIEVNMTQALRVCQSRKIPLTLVAVSHAHAQAWQAYYPVSHVIYNGLDTITMPHCAHHNGTLAFAGRISPQKGVEDAIAVAQMLGKQLHLYGSPQATDRSYFQSSIEPLLHSNAQITYHGLVDHATLFQALSQAQAVLFPMKWDEPFGYVIAEAMAVGTPVIIYDRGSARELVAEGISGFVVPPDDLASMAMSVKHTEHIDRHACAEHARQKFSQEQCVEQYLKLMQTLLNTRTEDSMGVAFSSSTSCGFKEPVHPRRLNIVNTLGSPRC